MKRRGHGVEEDVPALAVGPTVGHYTTGFSAVIKDGRAQDPVSGVGPIGFLTRPLSPAALKRLNRAHNRRRGGGP